MFGGALSVKLKHGIKILVGQAVIMVIELLRHAHTVIIQNVQKYCLRNACSTEILMSYLNVSDDLRKDAYITWKKKSVDSAQ